MTVVVSTEEIAHWRMVLAGFVRQERRVAEVLRQIEAEPHEAVTRDIVMSPYHFRRTFNAVSGVTPYQFVLAQRLRHAAVRLRRTTGGSWA